MNRYCKLFRYGNGTEINAELVLSRETLTNLQHGKIYDLQDLKPNMMFYSLEKNMPKKVQYIIEDLWA